MNEDSHYKTFHENTEAGNKRNASFHGVNFEVDLNLPLEHALATGTDEEAAEVSNNLRRKQNNDQFNIQIKRKHFFIFCTTI